MCSLILIQREEETRKQKIENWENHVAGRGSKPKVTVNLKFFQN